MTKTIDITKLDGWRRYVRAHLFNVASLSEDDIEAIAVEFHDKAMRRAASARQCQQGRS